MTARGRPLRVAFVIDTLRPGAGTENQLLMLLRLLDRRRVVPLLCCLQGNSELERMELPCEVELLDVTRLASLRGVSALWRLRDMIREKGIDLVVTFFRDASVLAVPAGFLAGVPVIAGRRNLGYWHTPFELFVARCLNRCTDAWVANSEAAAQYAVEAERVRRTRIVVIPNAVDTERFHPPVEDQPEPVRDLGLPAGRPLIGCVANLRRVKGQDVLLRAFCRVRDALPAARLVLVGDGPDRTLLESMIGKLGLTDVVTLVGARDDVEQILRALDVGVLSSRSESAPNALLEYLACGLPVVATRVGGVAELLPHATRGRLVPSEDAAAMAQAILGLCRDAGPSAGERRASHEFIEAHHSRVAIVERWHQFLEQRASGTATSRAE